MPKRIPLRTKLIGLFIVIALVPLLAVTAITITKLQQTERQNALQHANQIAKTTSEEIKSFIISQFGILENIQVTYQVLSDAQRQNLTEQVLFLSDTFDDLSILNSVGKEIVRKNRIEVVRPQDLRDESTTSKYQGARDSGAYIGPLYLVSGKPFFTLAVALRTDAGTFSGVVAAEVDARTLQEVVQKVSTVSESGRAYIVNTKGTVIAHPDISFVLGGADFSSVPPVSALITGIKIDQLKSYRNDEGQEVIGTVIPIDLNVGVLNTPAPLKTNWVVVTEQRADVALKPVQDLLRLELALLTLALIIAAFAAVIVAGRIVHPITLIRYGLQQFGQNNLRYRVNIKSNDETRDLAEGFNSMAENLGRSVAELKEERETIAVERNKLALVLSGISDAVIAINLSGEILTFNAAAEQLLNFPADRAIGKPIDEVFMVKIKQRVTPYKSYIPTFEEDGNAIPYQNDLAEVVLRNGKVVSVTLLVRPLNASPRVPIGWIITVHDLTKEQAAESIKREFVSIAAHQLRTPLTAIKWSTDMFLTGYAGIPTAEQKSLIEKAHQSTDRMIMLVNDLLNTARIEDGRLVGPRRPTDAVKLMQSTIDALKDTVEKKKHVITFTPPKEPLPLLVLDDESMGLAFQNLLENAVRYTKEGGRIDVLMERRSDELAIVVADNGVGIPADQQERIFTKFFRGRNAVNMETEGSGLGMFISKNIIMTHGGKISFVSKENAGTTTTILLPLRSNSSAEPDIMNAPKDSAAQKKPFEKSIGAHALTVVKSEMRPREKKV